MQQSQINLVREYHGLTVSCQNQCTYIFGRGSRRGLVAGLQKFVRCDSEYVSRRHFQVFSDENNVWKVKDLNSMNGTFVNETLLSFGEVRILRRGDKIGVGICGVGPQELDRSDPKYFIFKFVQVSNRDADGFAIPFPVHVHDAQPRLRGMNIQIMRALRNVRRMQRSHLHQIRLKHVPNGSERRSPPTRAGTSSLATRILSRWYSRINDQVFKRRLRKAIHKLTRRYKAIHGVVHP